MSTFIWYPIFPAHAKIWLPFPRFSDMELAIGPQLTQNQLFAETYGVIADR